MKRFFTLWLVSCFCMCLLASVNSVNGIYYDFNAQTLTATLTINGSASGSYTGKLTVPATVVNPEDGLEYAVTAVDNYALANCNGSNANVALSEIDFSAAVNITSIGSSAFRNSKSLKTIILPPNLVSLGDYAFYNCTALEVISLPQSVTTVGQGLFEYCTKLRDVTLSDAITELGNFSFQFCEKLPAITLPANLEKINNSLFSNCSNLGSIIIPSSVNSIGEYAFRDCSSLTNVEFNTPNSTLEIQQYAFSGCSNLGGNFGRMEFPEGLTHIYSRAFRSCSALKEISLPSTLKVIASEAFSGVNNLSTIRVKATTPPSLAIDGFSSLVFANATVYCVCGLEVVYRDGNTTWNKFQNFASENADEDGTMLTLSPTEADKDAFGGYARIDQRPSCENQIPYYVISAVPNPGYEFVGWSDGSDVQYNRRLTVTNVFSLNASFKKIDTQTEDPFEQEVLTITYYKGNPVTDPDNAVVYKTQKLSTGDIINLYEVPESVGRCAAWSEWRRTDGKAIPDRISESFDVYTVSSGSMPIALHVNRGEIIDIVDFDCSLDLKTQLDAYKETFTQTLSDAQFADIFNPQCESILKSTWTLFDDWIPATYASEEYLHVNINSYAVSHKVTFVVRGKETVKEYSCDEEILFPVFTLETCEEFDGWYDSAEPRLDANGKDTSKRYGLLNSINGLFKTDEDLTLYARFKTANDTVRYVIAVLGADAETGDIGLSFATQEGGKTWKSIPVECGSKHTILNAPQDLSEFVGDDVADQYRFMGWYSYKTGESITVTTNMVIVGAVVPRNQYTLTIYDEDLLLGSIPLAAGSNLKEIVDELNDYIVDKKGVEPLGWRFRLTGEDIDESTTMPAADMIIESYYEVKKQHDVVFQVDGTEVLRKSFVEGEQIPQSIIPTKVEGLSPCTDLVEWDMSTWQSVMGVSNIYIRGTQPNEVTDTIFLHRDWAVQAFDMLFVPCRSNPNDALAEYVLADDDACMTFENSEWLTFSGDIIPNTITSNIHVNISSKPRKHTVTFVVRGKEIAKEYVCGEEIVFPIFKPEACEVFEGWYDADGKRYGLVDGFNGMYTTDKDLTITARFSAAKDTVRYVVMVLGADAETGDMGLSFASQEGGKAWKSVSVDCGSVHTVLDAPKDLSAFVGDDVADQYRFIGWYSYPSGEQITVNSNMVIVGAVVPRNRYTLTFYDADKILGAYSFVAGTELKPILDELTENMIDQAGQLPTHNGGELLGWRFRLTGEEIVEGTTMPAADMIVETFYREVAQHDLIFKVGNTEILRKSYYEGEVIPSSIVPTDREVAQYIDGCDKFIGWDKDLWSNIAATGQTIAVVMGDCDIVITAQTRPQAYSIYVHKNWSATPSLVLDNLTCNSNPLDALSKVNIADDDECMTFAGAEWLMFNGDIIPSALTSDIHVNINSRPQKHTVTFVVHGEIYKTKDYACVEQVAFPQLKLTKDEELLGWYVQDVADESEVHTYVDTDDYTTSADVTLVADIQSIPTAEVIFILNGAEYAKYTVVVGEQFNTTPNNPDLSPCEAFVGWDKEIPFVMPQDDVIISAKTERQQYTIYLHKNWSVEPFDKIENLDCETNPVAQLKDYQIDNSDPCITFDGSEWLMFNGDLIAETMSADIHVNINSKAVVRHLQFIANGEVVFEADYKCDDVITLPSNVPNLDCAVFTGKWHLQTADSKDLLDQSKPFVLRDYPTLTQLHADYLAEQHTVFYHLVETALGENGEISVDKSTPYSDVVECGTTITVRPDQGDAVTVPAGFTFVGWYAYPQYTVMPNSDIHYFGAVVPNQSYALMIFNGSDLIAYYNIPEGYSIKAEFDSASEQMAEYASLTNSRFDGWLNRTTGQVIESLDVMPAENLILQAYFVELPKCDYTLTLMSANRSQGTVQRTADYVGKQLSCNDAEVEIEALPNDKYVFVSWSNGVTDNPYHIQDISKVEGFDPETNTLVLIANFTAESVPEFATYNVEIGVNDSVMGYVDAVVYFKALPAEEGVNVSWLATNENTDQISVNLDGNNSIIRIADFTTDAQRRNMPRQFRNVTTENGLINVVGQDGKQIDIFDSHGQVIYSGPARAGIRVPQAGHYILRIDQRMALIEVK